MLTGLVYSAHLCSLLLVGLNQTYRLVDWFCYVPLALAKSFTS